MGNTINDKFIAKLKSMNSIVKADIKAGKKWTYKNSNQEHTFEQARKKNNRVTNCVQGVRWGLRGLIPDSALGWYGVKGKIQWANASSEKNARKYFDIIKVGNKTVKQLYNQGQLCEGDILMYMSLTHTNANIGYGKSFDTGHAYCIGQTFKKWIGNLSCKSNKVSYIFRLKDRTHYIVQAGAFNNLDKANQRVNLLEKHDYSPIIKMKDNMYKIQIGYFDGKENAEIFSKSFNKRKIKDNGEILSSFVTEA